MITQRFNPDPSDLSTSTIQQLFYRQVRDLSVADTADNRLKTFDMQFSDAWL